MSNAQQLNDDIIRVKRELDHQRRTLSMLERDELHISRAVEEKRKDLDTALAQVKRAQHEADKAQQAYDDAIRRQDRSRTQKSEGMERESHLMTQLRDLTNQFSDAHAADTKQKDRSQDSGRSNFYSA